VGGRLKVTILHDPTAGIQLPTDEMREAYITRAE
jgi:hypothetical protein